MENGSKKRKACVDEDLDNDFNVYSGTEKKAGVTEDLDNNFNVYAGTEMGHLRGVYFGPNLPVVANNSYPKGKIPPIVCIAWADESEKEVLVGFSNHVVKTYDTKIRAFTKLIPLDVNEQKPMVSLFQYNDNFICGFESGKVSMWNFLTSGSTLDINTGKHLEKVRQCNSDSKFIATGGNENNLKVWDISNPNQPIYAARNMPNDELELRVPVWVQDVTFMPHSSEILSACSRYGEVMMYDIRAKTKNRPVTYMKKNESPYMSISTTMNDKQILVGSTKGLISLIDFRNPKKGMVAHTYKGHVGSVRSIVAHDTTPYFISCGLDSHVYLHILTDQQPIKKLWLIDRLNCLLMTKGFSIKDSVVEGDGNYQILTEEVFIKKGVEETPIDTPKKIKKTKKNKISIS